MSIKTFIADKKQKRREREAQIKFEKGLEVFARHLGNHPTYISSRFDYLIEDCRGHEQEAQLIGTLAEYPDSHRHLYDKIGRFLQARPALDPALQLECCRMLTGSANRWFIDQAETLLIKSPLQPESRLLLLNYMLKCVTEGQEAGYALSTAAGLLRRNPPFPAEETEILLDIHAAALPKLTGESLAGLSTFLAAGPQHAFRNETLRLIKRGFRYDVPRTAWHCFKLAQTCRDTMPAHDIQHMADTAINRLRFSLEEDDPWNRNRTAAEIVNAAAASKGFGGTSRIALAFVVAAVNKKLVYPEAWPRETYESWKAARELAALFDAANAGQTIAEKTSAALPPAPPSLQ